MNELSPRSRYSKSSIIVRDDRISLEMEFSERSSLFKFVSRAISGGMEPVMLLEDKFRSSKLARLAICVGKNPISFNSRSRLFNKVRFVICVGKNPTSFSERSRLSNLVVDDKNSHVVGNERPGR